MRHLIIGSGVIGRATGIWLLANNEDVVFYDINADVLSKLEQEKYKVIRRKQIMLKDKADIVWICTAEWDVEAVLEEIKKDHKMKVIVIRSTMPVGETKKLANKYRIKSIAHVPEFLRQKTAMNDIFNTDRIIIGTDDAETDIILTDIFYPAAIPMLHVDTTTSELIKYVSNCWLATQVSFWNEIKKICDKLDINPQIVANGTTLDKRISKYGSAMIGKPFEGFCFPKDLDAFIKVFEDKHIKPTLLKAVREVNETLK